MIYTAAQSDNIELPRLDLLSFLFGARTNADLQNRAYPPYPLRDWPTGKRQGRCGRNFRWSNVSSHLFYGIIAAGGVASLASPSFKTDELVRQIQQGSAKLCISCPTSQDILAAAAPLCGIPLDRCLLLASSPQFRLSVFNDPTASHIVGDSELKWERITDMNELENSLICLLYSSGTTGPPKGARLKFPPEFKAALLLMTSQGVEVSHLNLVSQAYLTGKVYRDEWRTNGKWDYRTLAHLPTAHAAGVVGYFVVPFHHGGITYWMPKVDFAEFVALNESLAITIFFSVPPIYLLITKSPLVKNQFRALRSAIAGAAPFGAELQVAASKRLGVHIGQTWGLSETTGSTTLGEFNTEDLSGSVGILLSNMKIRIVDDSGKDCPPNTPGEVLVSGPIVTKGYYKNPEANRETFKDGFLYTGDIGFFKDGRLHIVDRKKELIKYKGNQVAPAELEALLISHPQILDAGVIGVLDEEQATEVPRAYVVADKTVISARDIQEFVKSRLASHKQLRGGVEFVPAIPKSPSGKILRKDLRAMAVASSALKSKL
ncbi:4-coumarate-CoA ligase 2a [Mycena rebaudengoi]|nr:4-coumarate-CoA ligase 2a [Mycena rebaudengoi]